MTSKNISITEEVYNKLIAIKGEKESFSELFLRLLKVQRHNIDKLFGTWSLSEEEEKEIWDNITNRPGRKWKKSSMGNLK